MAWVAIHACPASLEAQPIAAGSEAAPPPSPFADPTVGGEVATDEARVPAPEPSWPDRLGPFELSTEDGHSRLGVSFAGQLMGRLGAELSAPMPEAEATLTFRRLRFALRGSLLDGALAMTAQINAAPGSVELLDLWLEYRVDPHLAIRAGQLTTPFTRYRQQSFRASVLVDWPIVTRFFGAERQLGAMLHNTATAGQEWSYAAGVFTGENARASHGIGASIAYGEPAPNPSDLTAPRPPQSFHPEVFARVQHAHPDVRPETGSDLAGGPLRHALGLSLAGDFQPERGRDLAARAALEMLLKAHGLSVNAIAYAALIAGEDGLAPGLFGALLECAYRFERHWELAARYARVARTGQLRADARRYADDRVAAAADEAERAALEARHRDVGSTGADQEVAVGFNAYVLGESLKLSLDLGWLRTERATGARDDLAGRLLVQLAF